MTWRHMGNYLCFFCALMCVPISSLAAALEYHGQVTFNGVPIPGATVTATQSDKKFIAITNQQGFYSFPILTVGTWTIEVAMTGFSTVRQNVIIATDVPATKWELKLLPLDQIAAEIKPAAPRPAFLGAPTPQTAGKQAEPKKNSIPELEVSKANISQATADGLLINGSVNNGAASPFAQAPAFGNHRNRVRGLYNGGIGIILDNSALDAKPFSLTGQSTPKPAYNDVTGMATLGGPLKIPHLLQNGPNFFVAYQWKRDRSDATQSAHVPDLAERSGDLSGQSGQIFDPATGLQFPAK